VDSAPSARPLRSMHTGQNSIAPENSFPQLEQVRWGSVFIDLTALQPQLSGNQRRAPSSGAKSAFTAPGKLLSRSTSNGVLLYTTAPNPISELNSCRSTSPQIVLSIRQTSARHSTKQLRLSPAGSFARKLHHQIVVSLVLGNPLPTRGFPIRLFKFRFHSLSPPSSAISDRDWDPTT
jgi:hypothetical protein